MQRPGQAGPAGATGPEVEMVLASAAGGFHALVPGIGKAVHSALGTFCTVYGSGIGDSHMAPMPSSSPTTQDTEVGICHTAPMPSCKPLIPSHGFISSTGKEIPGALGTFGSVHAGGVGDNHPASMPGGCPTTQDKEVAICHTAPIPGGQTSFQDAKDDVSHMASMPSSQLIIPSRELDIDKTIPLSLVVEFAHSNAAKMVGGLFFSQNMSAGVSRKATMLGDQTHVPWVGVGVCLLTPMPGGHPLPHSGLDHVDQGIYREEVVVWG
ncbi:hypothetical protein E2C01_057251 [Portunus trituberculatus]|uniref:Uncharacterized protein n=1 Tax=Portunus trituberculatus TaxID=210409 RepID=A0A5B7H1C3_PORTR|nr:hypothetical protein [Portunus trituberculatus]